METTSGGGHGDGPVTYPVPEGQDPAAIIVALERDGWTGTLDHENSHRLVIASRDGRPVDRDRVRVAVAAALFNTQGDTGGDVRPRDVRFADE